MGKGRRLAVSEPPLDETHTGANDARVERGCKEPAQRAGRAGEGRPARSARRGAPQGGPKAREERDRPALNIRCFHGPNPPDEGHLPIARGIVTRMGRDPQGLGARSE